MIRTQRSPDDTAQETRLRSPRGPTNSGAMAGPDFRRSRIAAFMLQAGIWPVQVRDNAEICPALSRERQTGLLALTNRIAAADRAIAGCDPASHQPTGRTQTPGPIAPRQSAHRLHRIQVAATRLTDFVHHLFCRGAEPTNKVKLTPFIKGLYSFDINIPLKASSLKEKARCACLLTFGRLCLAGGWGG
jgi:hypothetical protein